MADTSTTSGILDVANRGGGFLRRRENGFVADPKDVRVDERLIRELRLRVGDEIVGELAAPSRPNQPSGSDGRHSRGGRNRGRPGRGRDHHRGGGDRGGSGGATGTSLGRVHEVNGKPVETLADRRDWNALPATHPKELLRLEVEPAQPDFTNRVIDLLCPLGKGQRALVVAPAKAGKTMVLQSIARGVNANFPGAVLFILLVDERPEEVSEMEAAGLGEVLASSFDHSPAAHCACAELVLARAERRAELGDDVVLIVDSLTRLARAYNASTAGSGRTLSGGMDAQSLEPSKRFFGSARSIDKAHGGGSLTIIATALIDTGSKMDQLIYEEFKGTGNSELVLSRELADRRVFPAIDIVASGTRREELLLPEPALAAARSIRRRISRQPPLAAMNDLLVDLKRYPTNAALIAATPKDPTPA